MNKFTVKIHRIMAVMKLETNIASMTASMIGSDTSDHVRGDRHN
jgi:hypothetical protein